MAPAAGAHIFRNAIVTIDEEEYANQLRVARLVPDQPVQTYRPLVPDGVISDVDTPVWTFETSGLQINVAGGLAEALRAANGGKLEVLLQPRAGSAQKTATFTITALMPPFGGEQGSWLEQELTFPVDGQPVWGASA